MGRALRLRLAVLATCALAGASRILASEAPAPSSPAPVGATGASADEASPPAATAPAPAPAEPPPPPPPPARITGKVLVKGKDGAGKPGEGTIVYLESVDASLWKDRPAPPRPKVNMKTKKFEPRVVPVLAGQSVPFVNLDPVFHNVFSLSSGNKFDLGLYKDGKAKSQKFATPGVVRVFCNIHPSMSAHVLVLQNPFWTTVGADGTYRLADVPPGTWTVKAWNERGGESARQISCRSGQRATADFELDASGFKVVPHKNKFGKDYPAEGY